MIRSLTHWTHHLARKDRYSDRPSRLATVTERRLDLLSYSRHDGVVRPDSRQHALQAASRCRCLPFRQAITLQQRCSARCQQRCHSRQDRQALFQSAAPSPSTGLGLGIGAQPGASAAANNTISKKEYRIIASLVLVALFIRMRKLGQPSSVVFDEVHFGGFASKYIQGRFFMDVHPPLAKLLITLAAWLGGFNGNFDFKDIGREYLHGKDTPVPYVTMRALNALLGVATIPLAYLTLRGLSLRASTATLGAIFVLFDNALITQSRLILLDSILVFFTALTVYFWVAFCNEEKRAPFSARWWALLSLTGLSLGAVASSKWVGLFTIATIGISVIAQLWEHLGDVRQPVRTVARHFCARAVCLIGFPIFVYLLTFAIHLALLHRSGEGDPFMSSAFQHTLHGHGMDDTYADVALGSIVSIKHLNTQVATFTRTLLLTLPEASSNRSPSTRTRTTTMTGSSSKRPVRKTRHPSWMRRVTPCVQTTRSSAGIRSPSDTSPMAWKSASFTRTPTSASTVMTPTVRRHRKRLSE